jgi:scyllo-inositol 2-dehydrogenase (NADP+)
MARVGLVGFGMAGRVFHAPLISSVDGLELAAVVERHSDQAAQRYLGKLIELAQKHGRLLIPFHNRRWDGDFLTIQRLLREHQLGRVVSIESRFDRWNPGSTRRPWKDDPEQGGGVLLDLGTHLVDQALVLCGKPLGVSAEVLRERDGEGSDDAFTVRLRYDRCFVTLGANALSSPAGARFHVRGTRGNFRKKDVDPQEAALNKVTRIETDNWGQEPQTGWGVLRVDVEGGMVSRPVATLPGDYRLFYAGVRDALTGKGPAPVPALDAWRVARVLEWARESAHQRSEVECDWSGELGNE